MPTRQLKTSIIYCGDNIKMLKEIPDESVDLIYIDPPFNSNRNYEIFWGDIQEKRAFEDRFGDAQHYIDWMRPRVLELYRVLKKTGSFYYHCDWHASHYVKIMLDQIFDFNNFQNEIIWRRQTSSGYKGSSCFGKNHDVIFFYSKSKKYTFNNIYNPYSEEYIKTHYNKIDEKGRKYRTHWIGTKTTKETIEKYLKTGRIVKRPDGKLEKRLYLDEQPGIAIDDIWEDIKALTHGGKERLGFPTQKPLALLERIIKASSNKGNIVLDAFCGCGTTLVAAEKYKRKWIGIDISPTACRVMSQRLQNTLKLKEGRDFILSDLPKTEEELMKLPHFEFQNWAVIALGGIPNRIKVGDYGIDGKLYPIEQERIKSEEKGLFGDIDIYYPIQVKQKERAGRPDIDNFETAMRRDKRKRGYFISFGFTEDAIKEIKRLDKEGEIEIMPITVKDLLAKESLNRK